MARNDPVNRTADLLPGLSAETGLTALLSIWGSQGPTVVRWERSAKPIVTTLGLGSVFPLINSATGRIFLSYLPRTVTRYVLSKEGVDEAEANSIVTSVRDAGYAGVEGRFIPGLAAISAPVLDWQGSVFCAVTLIATNPEITSRRSDAVQSLTTFCSVLSAFDNS